MAFKYQRRSPDTVEKRASQQGNEFLNFIGDSYKTFASKKGDNWIRILPPTWDNPDHYGYDVHAHYQVGPDKGSVLCNYKQFDQRCPICDGRTKAERDNDEDLAKDLKPSKRVCVWLIDMKDPDKGPMIWAMPWSFDRDISKISKDKRSGEIYYIDDPDAGYDVMFDREGEGITTKYTGAQLARRPSSVDPKHLQYVVNNPLPDTLVLRTYDEVMQIFSGGQAPDANGGRNRPEDSARPPRPSSRPSISQDDAEPLRDARNASSQRDRVVIEHDDENSEPDPAPKTAVRSSRPKIAIEEEPEEEEKLEEVVAKIADKPTEGNTRGQTLRERFAARNAGK